MTMQFSAYQIESMLDDYQQKNFPSERSASENLSFSEEAIIEAREHFTTSTKRTSIWKSPKEIIELIEDKNEYDPVVDFVQQSRAGRFVDPVYVPENSPPTFSLVTDYSKNAHKGLEEEQEIMESEIVEKEISRSKLVSGKDRIKDKVSVNEAVSEKDFSHFDQIKISINEGDTKANISNKSEKDIVKAVAKENIPEKLVKDEIDLTKSKKKRLTDSAAKMFENIEEDELDEELEFDEKKELHDEYDADNDVVFGDGQIDSNSIREFVKNFPDSAIKFMFRKNLDGRNLPVEYEEIYINWEKRGLSRGRLKNYLFKLMKWDNFPDIPILGVVQILKERQYDLKDKKK